ncbi:MAG: LPS assembly protein LptD [Pseudomonadota bacterium]
MNKKAILAAASTGLLAAYPVHAQQDAGEAGNPTTTAAQSEEEVILVAERLYEDQARNLIIAEGGVEATYGKRTLRADRVVFDRNTEKVRATGNVVIVDGEGTEQFANEIEVDSDLSGGFAIGFSMRMGNGATAVANAAIREEGGINALDQIVYTACEICEEGETPTWSLRARRAILNEQTKMISYRDAVLEVGGVPVFYLPYLAHPDPTSGRRSGLLFPDAGLSTTVGWFYQQPYYWAISDSQELTISPRVHQRVNPLLELDYSKRFWSGQVNINTSITQERLFDGDGERLDDSDNSLRSHIFADGVFRLTDKWLWGFGAERVTDDLYLGRYDIDGEDNLRGLYASQPRRLLSQLFAVGQDDTFYADAALLAFQGLRQNDENSALPLVLPYAFAERLFDLGDAGLAGVQVTSTAITRDEGDDSQRVSAGFDWSTQRIIGPGLVARPFAEGRFDFYALDEDIAGTGSATRSIGHVGATLSYPLVRRGNSVDVTVEPIVMGSVGTSGSNDEAIPNEDSLLFELYDPDLFDPDASGGFDLVDGGNHVAAGFFAKARWKNGVELAGSAGRRWKSESETGFDPLSNLDGTSSDWISSAAFKIGRPLSVATSLRFDDEDLSLNRIDARVSTQFWRVKAAAQYYKIDESIAVRGVEDEAVSINGTFQLTDRFNLSYARIRDIADNFDSRHSVGIGYQDGCALFQLAFQRTDNRDRELGPSESVTFRFSLLSLGELGSQDVD